MPSHYQPQVEHLGHGNARHRGRGRSDRHLRSEALRVLLCPTHGSAQLDRSTLLVSGHEGANLPNARVPFTDSSHVAQRSICRDKVGMKSKFSPVGDGNNPRNYYLSRCFATTTRCTWLVPS